jgi:SSS family solute:Na+ symporter
VTATLLLLLGYSIVLVAAGLVVSRRVSRTGEFFVAGRRLSGRMVFVTLLAANVGAGSTVGATGLGYQHGLSAWWWSGSAALGCLILGFLVAPRLHRLATTHGFLTLGDFLDWRFDRDRSVRGLIAAILWLGTLSILAGQLIAMAWALNVVAGVPKAWGCVFSGAVLVTYVSGGGLLASVWVNLIELAVLLVGFLLAVPYVWTAAGGWDGLATAAGPELATAYAGFTGMGLAAILPFLVTFVPSFAVSPGLVQKTYGARSAAAASRAALANAAALAVFAFVPALLGMAARRLLPDLPNRELALPGLLLHGLPPWLGALGLAALFAAEISTADAVLFMLSTSLSRDLYQTFLNPSADDRTLLRVGRLTAVGAGILGVGLAVVLPTVADALKAFYGIMTASLFVPVIVGLVTSRPTARSARWAVVLAVLTTGASLVWLQDSSAAGWAPFVIGMAAASAAFLVGARR